MAATLVAERFAAITAVASSINSYPAIPLGTWVAPIFADAAGQTQQQGHCHRSQAHCDAWFGSSHV